MVNQIADFFLPYDVYEQRLFEGWEIAIMFLDFITAEEADSVVTALAGRSSFGAYSA